MTTNIMKSLIVLAALLVSHAASAVTYVYDNLNRLTSATFDSGPPQIYTYDPAGNLLTMSTTGVTKANQTVSFGAAPTLAVSGTGTVSATATSALTVSFTSTTPTVCTVIGSTVTGVAAGACTIAADQTGDANYNAATQATLSFSIAAAQTTQTVPPASTKGTGGAVPATTLSLAPSWNLVGNSINAPLDVATVFGDAAKVTTVWKWIPTTSKWAFYAPSMTARNLATYAAGKGYDVLATVDAGEGFWVNAKTAFTATVSSGNAVAAAQFGPALPKGWSLISLGEAPQTPAAFNTALGYDITTLWAWDNPLSKWYFYAPSLERSGGLQSYIQGKGYFDFTQQGKTLGWGTGFWVNKP